MGFTLFCYGRLISRHAVNFKLTFNFKFNRYLKCPFVQNKRWQCFICSFSLSVLSMQLADKAMSLTPHIHTHMWQCTVCIRGDNNKLWTIGCMSNQNSTNNLFFFSLWSLSRLISVVVTVDVTYMIQVYKGSSSGTPFFFGHFDCRVDPREKYLSAGTLKREMFMLVIHVRECLCSGVGGSIYLLRSALLKVKYTCVSCVLMRSRATLGKNRKSQERRNRVFF